MSPNITKSLLKKNLKNITKRKVKKIFYKVGEFVITIQEKQRLKKEKQEEVRLPKRY